MIISINIHHRAIIWYILKVYIKLHILRNFWMGGSTGKNWGVGRGVQTQPNSTQLYQTLQKLNYTLYIS